MDEHIFYLMLVWLSTRERECLIYFELEKKSKNVTTTVIIIIIIIVISCNTLCPAAVLCRWRLLLGSGGGR